MLLKLSDIEESKAMALEQAAIALSKCDVESLFCTAEAFADGRLEDGPVENQTMRLALGLAVPTLLEEIAKRLAAIEAN